MGGLQWKYYWEKWYANGLEMRMTRERRDMLTGIKMRMTSERHGMFTGLKMVI